VSTHCARGSEQPAPIFNEAASGLAKLLENMEHSSRRHVGDDAVAAALACWISEEALRPPPTAANDVVWSWTYTEDCQVREVSRRKRNEAQKVQRKRLEAALRTDEVNPCEALETTKPRRARRGPRAAAHRRVRGAAAGRERIGEATGSARSATEATRGGATEARAAARRGAATGSVRTTTETTRGEATETRAAARRGAATGSSARSATETTRGGATETRAAARRGASSSGEEKYKEDDKEGEDCEEAEGEGGCEHSFAPEAAA
jgi:hypothetical protein